MLRLYNDQPDLWEATLPKQLQGLPPELAAMDTLLRDSAFTAPFEAALRQKVREEIFSDFQGRPSTFLASYVRLMVLKFRRDWSYEELLVHVNESVFLRRFCGYSLSDELPDDTTLIKLTGRLGDNFVKTLNRALVIEAKKRRLVQGQRMRVDTTVVGAHIRYPTDTGLLADSIRVIGRLVKKIKAKGLAKAVAFRDRTRWAKKIVRQLGQQLKDRDAGARGAARRAKEKLLKAAGHLQRQAKKVHGRIQDSKDQAARRWAEALAVYLALLQKLIDQTEQVLQGQFSIPGRLVSLFD
jgi:IS5 family transposase